MTRWVVDILWRFFEKREKKYFIQLWPFDKFQNFKEGRKNARNKPTFFALCSLRPGLGKGAKGLSGHIR